MGIEKHKAQTRSERLIHAMEALTVALNKAVDRLDPPEKGDFQMVEGTMPEYAKGYMKGWSDRDAL